MKEIITKDALIKSITIMVVEMIRKRVMVAEKEMTGTTKKLNTNCL